jgi:DNA repair exonuclease SbcCD nuclease subunit
MRRAMSGKNHYQLKCETRHYYEKSDCVLVSIGEDTVKEILLEKINEQVKTFGKLHIIGSSSVENKNSERTEILRLQSEISKNSRFLQSLYESLSQGDITSDEFKEMKSGYEIKIAGLQAKEKELRNHMLNRAAKEAEESKTAAQLHGVRQICDLTAETLNRLIKKIVVFEDKRVEVHFTFTDEIAYTSGVDCSSESGPLVYASREVAAV